MPALILTRDRLTMARALADELARRGLDVVLLDCNSAYPPMLDWLASCPYRVVRAGTDVGWLAPWTPDESGVTPVGRIMGEPGRGARYLVTDPDLDVSGVPADLVARLSAGLDAHPWAIKAGLSLRTDDLPPDRPWPDFASLEAPFWAEPLCDGFYRAAVDTTLALYDLSRPMAPGVTAPAIRSAPPYTARHLPWYQPTAADLDDDDLFYYRRHAHGGHWSRLAYADALARGPARPTPNPDGAGHDE